MIRHLIPFAFLFLVIYSCSTKEKTASPELIKQQIIDTENNFVKALQENGLHDAFVAFADDNAILIRGTELIKGKNAIDAHYKNQHTKDLTWKVDFVEISKSGDLGYTYGEYIYSYQDSIGNQQKETGVFNTIWKLQKDGTWKYVKD